MQEVGTTKGAGVVRGPSPRASQALLKDVWAVEGHRGGGSGHPCVCKSPDVELSRLMAQAAPNYLH